MREKNRQTIAPSSKAFFENGMRGHMAVKDITDLGNSMYIIKRTMDRPDIKVLVADIYIAGEAEILEINPNLYKIDCIVLIGFYNQYSGAAKELAKSMGVGLHTNREFFGAVNLTGNSLINYIPKKNDG